MALGFPIISTNVGGIPYLIKDQETGLLVPPKNKLAILDAIKTLLENPEFSRKPKPKRSQSGRKI